jgi:hypothetical protein
MLETRPIEVRLLNGKRRDVRISDSDDVLAVHQQRDPVLIMLMGLVTAVLRKLYSPPFDPVPMEFRRTSDGTLMVGVTASFATRSPASPTYYQVQVELVREVLERAERDGAEIARWCAPPRGKSAKGKPRGSKAEALKLVIEDLAENGPYGWSPRKVTKAANCALGYFYKCRRNNPAIRKSWMAYLQRSSGRGPVRLSDL